MKRFLLLLFLMIPFVLNSQVPDETKGLVEVHNYLSMLLENRIDEQYREYKNYIHPDAIILGGYSPSFYILNDNYEVINVWNEILDLNCMTPGEEDFLAVELSIPALGKIESGEFYPENEFRNIFYLSRSTGEPKILDTSESIYFMMSLEDSIEWLEARNEKRDYYKPAYNDLLAYLEEKQIPIP